MVCVQKRKIMKKKQKKKTQIIFKYRIISRSDKNRTKKKQKHQRFEYQKHQQNLIKVIRKKIENSPRSFNPEAVTKVISEFAYNSDDGINFMLILKYT